MINYIKVIVPFYRYVSCISILIGNPVIKG